MRDSENRSVPSQRLEQSTMSEMREDNAQFQDCKKMSRMRTSRKEAKRLHHTLDRKMQVENEQLTTYISH